MYPLAVSRLRCSACANAHFCNIPASLNTIYDQALTDCSLSNIDIPSTCSLSDDGSRCCASWQNINARRDLSQRKCDGVLSTGSVGIDKRPAGAGEYAIPEALNLHCSSNSGITCPSTWETTLPNSRVWSSIWNVAYLKHRNYSLNDCFRHECSTSWSCQRNYNIDQ